MKIKFLKLVALALVILLVFSVFAACKKSDEQTVTTTTTTRAATTTAGTTTTAGETQPEEDPYRITPPGEVITLKWLMRDNDSEPISATGPVWAGLEKITGIKIDPMIVPENAINDQLQLLTATRNLPDIVQSRGDDQGFFFRYGMEGAFLALDDLYEQYGDNIRAHVVKDPQYEEFDLWTRAIDGKMYVLPTFRPLFKIGTDGHFMIRGDWLDKLGIDEPNDLDEFYDVLKTFVESDLAAEMEGIAAGQTIGYMFRSPMSDMDSYFFLFDIAWDWFAENGVLYFGSTHDRMKDAVGYLNKLVNEGLAPIDLMGAKGGDVRALWYSGKLGAMISGFSDVRRGNESLRDMYTNVESSYIDRKGYFVQELMPMKSISGVRRGLYASAFQQPLAISSDTKHPVEAFKFLDRLFMTDVYLYAAWGVAGPFEAVGVEDAGIVEVVARNVTDLPQYEGIPATLIRLLHDDWEQRTINFSQLGSQIPMKGPGFVLLNVGGEIDDYRVPDSDTARDRIIAEIPFKLDYRNTLGHEFRFFKFTEEQMTRISELVGPLYTIRDEYLVRFITGGLQINDENWNRYINDMERQGMDELLEIYRSGYNRYLSLLD